MSQKTFIRHLAQILTKNQILVLTGPKMVGKRHLAEQVSKQLRRKILVLDLAKSSDRRKLVHPEFLFTAHFRESIILESLEFLPSVLEDIQRFLSNSKKQPKFIFTLDFTFGSIFRFFQISRKLVVQEVFPASLKFATENKSVSIWQHWLKGGFPGFLTSPSHRVTGNRADRLISEISNTDTSTILGHQLKPEKIERCLDLVAQLNGTILNSQLIARAMAVSGPTALRYVKYLESAMIVRLLPAFNAGSGKRLTKSPKIYLRDTGLLHHLRGIQTLKALSNSVRQPDSWETYVIEEVAKILSPRHQLHYYRTQHSAEAQLIISKINKSAPNTPKAVAAIFIQPGSLTQLTRGIRNSLMDLSTRKNFLIVGNDPGNPSPVLPDTVLTDLKSMNCVALRLPELLEKLAAVRI